MLVQCQLTYENTTSAVDQLIGFTGGC